MCWLRSWGWEVFLACAGFDIVCLDVGSSRARTTIVSDGVMQDNFCKS